MFHLSFQNLEIKKIAFKATFYADNTFLPLLRRRANTLRPPTVAILALNP